MSGEVLSAWKLDKNYDRNHQLELAVFVAILDDQGLVQSRADQDGLKCQLKSEVSPQHIDRVIFRWKKKSWWFRWRYQREAVSCWLRNVDMHTRKPGYTDRPWRQTKKW